MRFTVIFIVLASITAEYDHIDYSDYGDYDTDYWGKISQSFKVISVRIKIVLTKPKRFEEQRAAWQEY